MSEFAPTIEAPSPRPQPELSIAAPEIPAEDPHAATRYEDKDYAHEVAHQEDINRTMLAEARAQLARALEVKGSPLVDKYRQRVANQELTMKLDSQGADQFYRRYRAPQPAAAEASEDLRLAA